MVGIARRRQILSPPRGGRLLDRGRDDLQGIGTVVRQEQRATIMEGRELSREKTCTQGMDDGRGGRHGDGDNGSVCRATSVTVGVSHREQIVMVKKSHAYRLRADIR